MTLFILFGAGDGLPPMSGSSPPDDEANISAAIFFLVILLIGLGISQCSKKCSAEKTPQGISTAVPAASVPMERSTP